MYTSWNLAFIIESIYLNIVYTFGTSNCLTGIYPELYTGISKGWNGFVDFDEGVLFNLLAVNVFLKNLNVTGMKSTS